MLVHGINLDVVTNQPVIILRDVSSERFLPIWIGQFEATAILMELQGVTPQRPLTHDLLKSALDSLGAAVTRIVITELHEGTFFARIHLERGIEKLELDSRPSDAIALAVRLSVPIFAAESVLDQAAIVAEDGEEKEVEEFRAFLEHINPDDFRE